MVGYSVLVPAIHNQPNHPLPASKQGTGAQGQWAELEGQWPELGGQCAELEGQWAELDRT